MACMRDTLADEGYAIRRMDDELDEAAAIRELASEFAKATGQVASIPAPECVRRARRLVEAGWTRRCQPSQPT